MGRRVKDARLDTREARLKLKQQHDPYWRLIHKGLHLGYRKGLRGGVWIARVQNEQKKGYVKKVLGVADDLADSNGEEILSFKDAQAKANVLFDNHSLRTKAFTVRDAADHYLKWFKEHRKAYKETLNIVEVHIIPNFGDKLITSLTTIQIKKWHLTLAEQPARKRTPKFSKQNYAQPAQTNDAKRSRKATANRILTVLKAILNKAFQDELVDDDLVWRRVKPFENVNEPVIRFLTESECKRLINVCRSDFRELVRGALLTGARYGELTNLLVSYVNLIQQNIYITPSKSNKGRYIPLSAEGSSFFKSIIAGKLGNELVFTKSDLHNWGKNHHVRLLKEACKTANIVPAIGFHELRHTYASLLAQAGADLLTISKLLGHADTRITSRHYAHLCDKTLSYAVNTLLPKFELDLDKKICQIS